MRARFLVAVALLTSSCQREPDDLLFIVGRVVDERHGAIVGEPVSLLRNGSAACLQDLYFGRFAPDVDAGTFEGFVEATSNQRGDFLFELTERDSRGDENSQAPACFRVVSSTHEAESRIAFAHPGGDVELADLPLDRRLVSVQQLDGGLQLEHGGVPDLSEYSFYSTGWDLIAGPEQEPAWVTQEPDGGAAAQTLIDGELIEDFAGMAARRRAVALYSSDPAGISFGRYVQYTVDVRGAPRQLGQGDRVPLSRGRPCPPFSRDGGVCALTDGKLRLFSSLTLVEPFPVDPGASAGEIRIDLGAERIVRRAVLRGLDSSAFAGLSVEGSTDGGGWVRLGELAAATDGGYQDAFMRQALDALRAGGVYADIPLADAGPVRFVRLTGTAPKFEGGPGPEPGPRDPPGVFFYGARELSIF